MPMVFKFPRLGKIPYFFIFESFPKETEKKKSEKEIQELNFSIENHDWLQKKC